MMGWAWFDPDILYGIVIVPVSGPIVAVRARGSGHDSSRRRG